MEIKLVDKKNIATFEDIAAIRSLLEKQNEKEPSTLQHRVYQRAATIAKYVGIPSLLLGAFLPTYQWVIGISDDYHASYIRSQYILFANELIDDGKVARANKILSKVKELNEFDARTAFTSARLAAVESANGGFNYDDAEDTINIIIRIDDNKPLTFPELLSSQDRLGLKIALFDGAIESGRTQNLANSFNDYFAEFALDDDEFPAEIKSRRLKLLVLEHEYVKAKSIAGEILTSVKPEVSIGHRRIFAETKFQLAKIAQFEYEYDEALAGYLAVRRIYEGLEDQHGLARTLNNLGNIYQLKGEAETALNIYHQLSRVSRRIGNRRALARALLNSGAVLTMQRKHQSAIKQLIEALAIFRENKDILGIASSQEALSHSYHKRLEIDKALAASEDAFELYLRLSNIRGMGNTSALTADLLRDSKLYIEAVRYYAVAFILKKHSNSTRTETVRENFLTMVADIPQDKFELGKSKAEEFLEVIKVRLERSDIDFESGFNLLNEVASLPR